MTIAILSVPLLLSISCAHAAVLSSSASHAVSSSSASSLPHSSSTIYSYPVQPSSTSSGLASVSTSGAYFFPPGEWLGQGLDLTAVTPITIDSVTSAVLQAFDLIPLSSSTTNVTVPNNPTIVYTVPANCDIESDTTLSEGGNTYWANGTAAAHSLETDATVYGKYAAISVTADANYAINKTFQSTSQYASFSFLQHVFKVQIKSYQQYVNETLLAPAIAKVPVWNPSNPSSTAQQYKFFFGSWGSHIITGATYGGRYQLNTYGSNSNSSVNTNWNADVAATYGGVASQGNFNASVKSTDQYSTFFNTMSSFARAVGGDTDLAGVLSSGAQNDTVYKTYQAWQKTALLDPAVISMQLANIWTIMSASSNPAIYSRAADFADAYTWITENPPSHTTSLTFTVTSDWGYFTLLTPGAAIDTKTVTPSSLPALTYGPNSIQWGTPSGSGSFTTQTFTFKIVNDGSPIDFETSHGSDGTSKGHHDAVCLVEINTGTGSTSYDNGGYIDGHWNSKFFFGAPVNQS